MVRRTLLSPTAFCISLAVQRRNQHFEIQNHGAQALPRNHDALRTIDVSFRIVDYSSLLG